MEVSRKGPRALSLLLAVRLAPGDVPGLDFQRQLPQGLFCQVVAEVVKERDDVFVALQLIMPEMRRDRSLINRVIHSRKQTAAVEMAGMFYDIKI